MRRLATGGSVTGTDLCDLLALRVAKNPSCLNTNYCKDQVTGRGGDHCPPRVGQESLYQIRSERKREGSAGIQGI